MFDLSAHLLAQAVSDEQHKRDLEVALLLAGMDYDDEDETV